MFLVSVQDSSLFPQFQFGWRLQARRLQQWHGERQDLHQSRSGFTSIQCPASDATTSASGFVTSSPSDAVIAPCNGQLAPVSRTDALSTCSDHDTASSVYSTSGPQMSLRKPSDVHRVSRGLLASVHFCSHEM